MPPVTTLKFSTEVTPKDTEAVFKLVNKLSYDLALSSPPYIRKVDGPQLNLEAFKELIEACQRLAVVPVTQNVPFSTGQSMSGGASTPLTTSNLVFKLVKTMGWLTQILAHKPLGLDEYTALFMVEHAVRTYGYDPSNFKFTFDQDDSSRVWILTGGVGIQKFKAIYTYEQLYANQPTYPVWNDEQWKSNVVV